MEPLTEDQEKFLEDCLKKFSDRFTDADIEYKKVLENGIPTPPIMFNNRDRYQGGSRYNNSEDNYNRGQQYNNYRDSSHHSRNNYRDRPY